MKNFSAIFTIFCLAMTLTLTGISDAEAKRFGSARSFGGKSSYGSPFKRSTAAKSTRSASQKKAYGQNQTARQSMQRRGGFMGMLGGLALGGLLGALFFGGAFEGFNFMDLLMFGGIAYLLLKLFAATSRSRRKTADANHSYQTANNTDYSSHAPQQPTANVSQSSSAGFDTNVLFNKNKSSSFAGNSDPVDADFAENEIPEGFDEQHFLAGAKGAFQDLQKAWDNHDLAEIRSLTTDKVFAEIQDQLREATASNQTELLKIDAELLSIKEIASELEAIVLFDTIMREEADSPALQIREVWHFIKPKNSIQAKWYLDGIQQLEQ